MLQSFPNGTKLDADLMDTAVQALSWNSSRNPSIDEAVSPGPYKEILPCEDVCYSLVQSCPASMGFSCPRPGKLGFNQSYGLRPTAEQQLNGGVTCNYPGATFFQSAAVRLSRLSAFLLVAVAVLACLI